VFGFGFRLWCSVVVFGVRLSALVFGGWCGVVGVGFGFRSSVLVFRFSVLYVGYWCSVVVFSVVVWFVVCVVVLLFSVLVLVFWALVCDLLVFGFGCCFCCVVCV
jgi:hypothetical protein